jgi:hypothetical protein
MGFHKVFKTIGGDIVFGLKMLGHIGSAEYL